MTPQEERALLDRVGELEAKLAAEKLRSDTWEENLLSPALIVPGTLRFGPSLTIDPHGIVATRHKNAYTIEATSGNYGASVPAGNEDMDQNGDGDIDILDLSFLAAHMPPRDTHFMWLDGKNLLTPPIASFRNWTDGATPLSVTGGSQFPMSSIQGISQSIPNGNLTEQLQLDIVSNTTWGSAGIGLHGTMFGSTDADASIVLQTDKADGTIAATLLVYSEDDGVCYVAVKDAPFWMPVLASDPTPQDGMVWYNSTDDKLYARINGATVELGGGGGGMVCPVLGNTFDNNSIAGALAGLDMGSPSSATYPTANLRMYLPYTFPEDVTVAKLWCYNGATASGNVRMALYNENGTIIANTDTGSVAQTGTSVVQEFNITDTLVTRGRKYISIALDNTTGTFFRSQINTSISVEGLQALGAAQEASAFAPPSTATFAAVANNYVPFCGFSLRTLVT